MAPYVTRFALRTAVLIRGYARFSGPPEGIPIMWAITRYSMPNEAKKNGTSKTRIAAGIHHTLLPSAGGIHAECRRKPTTAASGLLESQKCDLLSADAIAPN